jgi:SMI1 / KNR4 family (SUKH-1)
VAKQTHWNRILDTAWGHAKELGTAELRSVQPCDAVFERVRVFRFPDRVYSHRVTDKGLDELEARIGSRLSHSYREFMKRFGPGDLDPWVVLHRPSTEDGIVSRTELYREERTAEPDDSPNMEFLTRLVYFASSIGGDAYAWDPQDVTCPEPFECKVYYLERMHEDAPIAAGRSFWEFLLWTEIEYRHLREESTAGETPILRLHPWHVRMRELPRQNDVHGWLRHNNRTARLIALSIRDHGHTEAFPILADALEEAGCINADLLACCRSGDPHIDGAWVIRVLLGDE